MKFPQTVLTLAAALTMSLPAVSQETFSFVNSSGVAIPDGATVDITEAVHESDPITQEEYDVMYTGLSIVNTSDDPAAMRVVLTISRLDNGQFQFCFPMACQYFDQAGVYTTSSDMMDAGQTRDLLAEWFPMSDGLCEATMQVQLMTRTGSFPRYNYVYAGDGPSVKVRLGYNVPLTLRGDVNGDKVVDVTDVSDLINVVLGKVSAHDLPGDCHVAGNEGIDVEDISTLINIVLGKGNQ